MVKILCSHIDKNPESDVLVQVTKPYFTLQQITNIEAPH